ncbi:MAG: hypothetical protein KGL11_03925 [Alphaproteobacteria bacterium]|nr:hypothetical protein [Alphaproteobacteria bacterium]
MVSSDSEIYARLNRARRVWAVAPINGEAERLTALHRRLIERLEPGDRIVYLGNYLGPGDAAVATVDALLRFRALALARRRAFACDLAYLRGAQEAMWQKLQELQFAPNPREVLPWILARGLAPTLRAYGIDPRQGEAACREGTMAITRWTAGLRGAIDARPGHRQWLAALKRAAFTDDGALLFAHAGVDPDKPLEMQRDAFWWGAAGADMLALAQPYAGFKRIVCGTDRAHRGLSESPHAVLVDGGAGPDGDLVTACFAIDGTVQDRLAA